MKLSDAKEDYTYILTTLGHDEHLKRRTASIGLVEGTAIRVVRNQKKMPLLVFARDTLIAVNRKDSEEIEVTENV